MTTGPDLQPTQIRNPWRATLRTAVQTGIVVIPVLGLVVPQIAQIVLDEFGRQGVEVPGWFRAALLGVAAGATLLAAIVARVMAIPQVNQALKRVKLDAGYAGEHRKLDPALTADGSDEPAVKRADGYWGGH